MKKDNLNNYTRGWLAGNFSPAIHNTESCELAIKKYKANDFETPHYHLGAPEYTIIISGQVIMNGEEFNPDDIITIEPGEATDFYCKTDVVTVVYRDKSVKNDKFDVDENTTFNFCEQCETLKVSHFFADNNICKRCNNNLK